MKRLPSISGLSACARRPAQKTSPPTAFLAFTRLPPALAWLWRLVSPRGHSNPSIVDKEGMSSEGVGSYWPFATGRKVDQANLLLAQFSNTAYALYPDTQPAHRRVGNRIHASVAGPGIILQGADMPGFSPINWSRLAVLCWAMLWTKCALKVLRFYPGFYRWIHSRRSALLLTMKVPGFLQIFFTNKLRNTCNLILTTWGKDHRMVPVWRKTGRL